MTTSPNNEHIPLPELSLAELQAEAEKFLITYNPSGIIPVPIEKIVDLEMDDLEIWPIPDLKRQIGLDAYLSGDTKYIMIDDYCYNHNEKRTRFSIAHELSHVILHKDFYCAHDIDTVQGVLDFQPSLTDNERKFMENQAHTFAAHILMPPEAYKKAAAEWVAESGRSIDNMSIEDVLLLAECLANKFHVSEQAALRHMKHYYRSLHNIYQAAREQY